MWSDRTHRSCANPAGLGGLPRWVGYLFRAIHPYRGNSCQAGDSFAPVGGTDHNAGVASTAGGPVSPETTLGAPAPQPARDGSSAGAQGTVPAETGVPVGLDHPTPAERHRGLSRPFARSALLARLRATPAGRVTLKVLVAFVGAVVMAIGIVLIPLPGPGWMIVLGALAIWSIEFHWAERLLHFTRRQLGRWWRWMGRRSPLVRFLVGLAGLILIAAIIWAAVRISTGIDLIGLGWDLVRIG